ncbi:hypothetical protein [Thermomonospora umbrina]|uniref:Subtilisin inhibitor-like n=1 Tax=Thermomonospora umbrina TaxID=111806 RepID=A0A3D9SQF9_9ACTN|nr:hypothetical protein [Thermomonospora umbrina]REE96213.1 hypothetical protein DFJ69_1640 [Thermomonospora umbrina]
MVAGIVRAASFGTVLAVMVTSCAASHVGDVEATAAALFQAVRNGDGERACAALVPKARSGLETGDSRCAEEILTLGLRGGPLRDAEVWGDRARVRAGDDTVFLTRWASHWKVTAVGCRPRPGQPYECEVEA